MITRTARIARVLPTLRIPSVGFSKDVHDRESNLEKEYISKVERDQLRVLLSKLDKTVDPVGKTSRTKLHVIFEKYGLKLSKDAEADLRAWKNDGNYATA